MIAIVAAAGLVGWISTPAADAKPVSASKAREIAAVDAFLISRFRGCWHYFGPTRPSSYVPAIRIRLEPDGTPDAPPSLINPPKTADDAALAASAVKAVGACRIAIPHRFRAYSERWRSRVIRFDPL